MKTSEADPYLTGKMNKSEVQIVVKYNFILNASMVMKFAKTNVYPR